MQKILVSACLLGHKVRYNGSHKPMADPILERWQNKGRLIPFCPEVHAGLPVPRPPAEIVSEAGPAVLKGQAQIIDDTGRDVTSLFIKGAEAALATATRHRIRIAVLSDGSPSCGSSLIYDGTFSGKKKDGEGVVTALLRQNGVKVFGDGQMQLAEDYLKKLEALDQSTRGSA